MIALGTSNVTPSLGDYKVSFEYTKKYVVILDMSTLGFSHPIRERNDKCQTYLYFLIVPCLFYINVISFYYHIISF